MIIKIIFLFCVASQEHYDLQHILMF